MRLRKPVVAIVAPVALLALIAGAAAAATVTLDTLGQKATSDDPKLEAKALRAKGEQYGVLAQNTTLAPRDFTAVITGLKDRQYDVYINNTYVGVKGAAELAGGLALTANGTIADPDMIRCLSAAQPTIDSEYLRLRQFKSGEPQRVASTLIQAAEWTRSGVKTEKTFRSVAVIVAPTGQRLETMGRPTWLNDVETARTITRACWLLQRARSRMSTEIKDPDLRDAAVAAMTPVTFLTTWSVRNGKPHVDAVVTNLCNLPISGKVMAAVPKGWKWTAANTRFQDLKSGKSFKLGFDLVPTVKNAALPDGLKMTAAIELTQDVFAAKYNIKTVARKASSQPATNPAPGSKPTLVPPPGGMVQPKEIRGDR